MSELELKVNSGLKKIKVNDHGDYILIDVSDRRVFERYANLIDKLKETDAKFNKDHEAYERKYGGKNPVAEDGTIDMQQLRETADLTIRYLDELKDEIESVFGKDSIRKTFRDNYELNPDFVPDEGCLVDFVQGMAPIMEELYGERLKRNQTKYNVKFHGAQTKA